MLEVNDDKSLLRSLLKLNSSRGVSYAKLNQAMRASSKPGTPPNHFDMVCASVTEELRVASEAVLALRDSATLNKTSHSETTVKWIDALQDLEEKRLVAVVSLHVLHRSKEAGRCNVQPEAFEESETVDMKISRHSKKLQDIDTDINDLISEIREYVTEE